MIKITQLGSSETREANLPKRDDSTCSLFFPLVISHFMMEFSVSNAVSARRSGNGFAPRGAGSKCSSLSGQ